jgi:diketogulonate reductase-like aldo/keto reductase
MRALAAVKRAGMARHIGVSNFVPSLIREAVANCPEPLVCNQVEFHPWLAQEKLYAATRQAGMILTAYCPLGRGRLVSDPAIATIAKETKRTPAQVVLRWLLQIDGVAVIPKSAQKARIEENFAVFDFALSADQVARIGALGGTGGRVVNAAWAPDWAAEA